jgi:hypothetical protein
MLSFYNSSVRTDHLTCKGVMVFCFVQNFFFGQYNSYNICVSAFTTIGQGEENCTIEKTKEYCEYVCDNRTLLIPITVNGSLLIWQIHLRTLCVRILAYLGL